VRADVLLYSFFNLGAGKGVRSMPRPGRPTPGNEPVPFAQETEWVSGPFCKDKKKLPPAGFEPCRVQPVQRRCNGYVIQAGKHNWYEGLNFSNASRSVVEMHFCELTFRSAQKTIQSSR
jgi:hypothetical protein